MRISEYFTGKTILITGATGFMGKALVEKILRSCPDVSRLYVVIRTKNGANPQRRWSEITELPLFDKLKSQYPGALDKVIAIPGESTSDCFGLNKEDEKIMIDEVNIIYHVAASVRFTEELGSALKLNLKSTHSMLELAKKMKKLECFVHTSTAYSNIEKVGVEIEERVYQSPLDWRTMLKVCENEEVLECLPFIQPKIMSGHQTTYTLSKRIAESMVEEYSQLFPVVIIRPSLVISSAEDPIPGWLDAHNALTLMADAVRCGVVRIINYDPSKSLQFITLDLSIRAFLIATWNVNKKQMKSGVDVYCTSLGEKDKGGVSMTWGDIAKHGTAICQEIPAERQIWYPFCFEVRNSYLLAVCFFFLQVLPAILGDMFIMARGMKPQFFRMTTKYYKALTGPLRAFTGMNFHFSLVNYRHLDSILHTDDKKDFSIDHSNYDAIQLYKLNAMGMAKFVLQEDLTPTALKTRRERNQQFKLIHQIVSVAIIACFGYFFLRATLPLFSSILKKIASAYFLISLNHEFVEVRI